MSRVKYELEQSEEKRTFAVSVLLEVGALRECQSHEVQFDGGDVQDAYRRANALYSDPNSLDVELFESRREMTNAIKETYEELSVIDECPVCASE